MILNNQLIILLGGNEEFSLPTFLLAIGKLKVNFGNPFYLGPMYKTKAWGRTNQADYFNQLVVFEVDNLPEMILQICLQTEKELGRIRLEKWGSRLIDIDILFYGNQIIKSENLTIPHPYLQERRFALIPLNEFNPNFEHPVYKKTIQKLLVDCQDPLEVSIFKK